MLETPVLNLEDDGVRKVPLDALHRRLGGRMVAFAGYELPVQYAQGVMAEHLHCRRHAALFDVSHMGQIRLSGEGVAAALEKLVVGDIAGLKPGRQRYALLLNPAGGIVDDLMVANWGDHLVVVANASRKLGDAEAIAAALPDGVSLALMDDRALLALQGPDAAGLLEQVAPGAAAMRFMDVATLTLAGHPVQVSRSGYTGEDGYEISVPNAAAETVAEALLALPGVLPAGLGARDSLRLEAGLCLYGSDIDELTTPVEADLTWAIGKRRREAGDFPGAIAILDELSRKPHRRRVGLLPQGRAPARAGTLIVAADGTAAGSVTSGGFSPTLGAPVAMGYVRKDLAEIGSEVFLMIRGTPSPARVVALPFVPHRYAR